MGTGGWFSQDTYEILGLIGVTVGLILNALAKRQETKARRQGNLLATTTNHREIWMEYLTNPVFVRVRDPQANILQHPISEQERIFVTLVILHVNTVFYAMKDDLMVEYENLKPDLVGFFSNPIPRTVWQANKNFQNAAFVEFMENILRRP